jgi:hypothetical protein
MDPMTIEIQRVEKLFAEAAHNPSGFYRVAGPTPGGHPADGMTAIISMGDGAYSTIINPRSSHDGGPEWVMRYGAPESIRYTVAGLLETFDYLLSDAIPLKEATRRLRIMRAVRRDLMR